MAGDDQQVVMVERSTRVPTPTFSAENFKTYMEEVELWREVCDVPKAKQGIMLWLQLPREDASDIKELIMSKVGKDELKKETGIERFVEAMNEAFKPSDEIRDMEVYRDFYKKMERKADEKILDFINRFDKCANMAKRHDMDLPPKVKGLKLLDDAGLSEQDTKLVLTEIDFNQKEEVYKKAKQGLVKYMKEGPGQSQSAPIKLEVLTAADEEALVAKGWVKPGGGGRGGGGGRQRGGKTHAARGGGGGANIKTQIQKKENPRDNSGEIIRCPSCDSIRHLLADCPDSYENLRKFRSIALAAAPCEAKEEEEGKEEEEESYFTGDLIGNLRRMKEEHGEVDDVILYTGKKELAGLGSETLNCLLLDCGCSRNVMGECWWRSFKASLPKSMKGKVKESRGDGRKFRFGGDEVLPSIMVVKFPAIIAGKLISVESHVVKSRIPLLWSRPSMKKAGTVLDLPNDKAKIFGEWVSLNLTSVGHYSLDILPMDQESVEQALLTLPEDSKEKKKVLLKIHRQFGHPREETELDLLRKVNCEDAEAKEMLATLHNRCLTCKKFSPTPPRPVVSLPPASEFQEVLTLDLKEVKAEQNRYILHMIDAYTRYTCSVFIRNKKPDTIVHQVMLCWVANFGRPGKIWTDVGGEFNNDTMRQLGEAVGCKVETGAGYAAWMNGLNERNHAVVDRCLAKILFDNPKMDPTIALAWAVTAKNSYPMHGGYSSFQLVFGKQPNLPDIMSDKLPALEGVTTSESVAAHITAMYAGRKAFTEAMYDEKIRKALRHKVRAVERRYISGEQVFYRRDGDKKEWRGPATVIGNKGSVHYLVHQGEVVRVAACRLVALGDADEQIGSKEVEHPPRPGASLSAENDQNRGTVEVSQYSPKPEAAGEGEEEATQEVGEGVEVEMRGGDDEGAAEGEREGAAERERDAAQGERDRESQAQRIIAPVPPRYPKAGDAIQFKDGDTWQDAQVISRGGKASSKYKDYFNVRRDGESSGIYLDRVEWRKVEDEQQEEEEAMVGMIPAKEQRTLECEEAKRRELEAFQKFKVYEEVHDVGQERLSSRWIVTDKSTPTERKIKARLVCRGFEEPVKVQSDSPTGSKETLHMLLALAASNDWTVKSGDVKNAYLQGAQLDREVYMEAPPEERKEGVVWKLNKAVYGMNDAGRKWFFKVEETLVRLGCVKSKYDHCLFTYRKAGQLAGIILLWVDDIFHAGSKAFEVEVMGEIHREFLIGRTAEETFLYIGLSIETTSAGITLDQIDYIKERVEPAELRGGSNDRPLDKEEMKLLRRQTGKINWAATQSRPDLAYDVVELSTKFKRGTLGDLKKANKAINKLTSSPTKLLFPKINGKVNITTHSDAGFHNLPDQISSGRGHIIFLEGEGGRAAPLGWTSNKVKRVVGSTVAAEALSLQMALAHSIYLRAILAETLGVEDLSIPIKAHIDSNNLHQAIISTKFVEDKRLRLDIAQIQEEVQDQQVQVKWVNSGSMLADCLTKRTAKADQLMEALKTGRLPSLC